MNRGRNNRSFYRVQSEEESEDGSTPPRRQSKKRNRLKQFLVSSSTRFIKSTSTSKPTLSRKKTSRTNLSVMSSNSSSIGSITAEREDKRGSFPRVRGDRRGDAAAGNSATRVATGHEHFEEEEGGCSIDDDNQKSSSPLTNTKFPPNDHYFLSRAVVNSNAKYIETVNRNRMLTSYKRTLSRQGSATSEIYDLMYDTCDDNDEEPPSLEEISTNSGLILHHKQEDNYHTLMMESSSVLMATPSERLLSNSFIANNVVHQQEDEGEDEEGQLSEYFTPLQGSDDNSGSATGEGGGNENNDPIIQRRNDNSNCDSPQIVKGSWSYALSQNDKDETSGNNIIVNLDPTLAAVVSSSASPSLDDDVTDDDDDDDGEADDTVLLLNGYRESSSYHQRTTGGGERSSSNRTSSTGNASFHSAVEHLPATLLRNSNEEVGEPEEDQNESLYFSSSNLPLSLSSDDVLAPALPSPSATTSDDAALLSSMVNKDENNENCVIGDDKWVNNNSESSGANLPRMLSMCSDNTSQCSSNDEDSAAAILDTRNLPQMLGNYDPSLSSDNDDDSAAIDDAVLLLYELDGEHDDEPAESILALPSYPIPLGIQRLHDNEDDSKRYDSDSSQDEHDESTLMIQNYDPDADRRQIGEKQHPENTRRSKFPPLRKICSCGEDDTLEEEEEQEEEEEGNESHHHRQYLCYTDMDTSSERSNRVIVPPSNVMRNYDINRVAELDRWVAAENWQAIINASSSNLGKSHEEEEECNRDENCNEDDDRHEAGDKMNDEDHATSRNLSTIEQDDSSSLHGQKRAAEVKDNTGDNCGPIKEEKQVKSSSFQKPDDEIPPVEEKKATNSTSKLVLSYLNSSNKDGFVSKHQQPISVDDNEELIVELDKWVKDGDWKAIIRASSSNLERTCNDDGDECDAADQNRQRNLNIDGGTTSIAGIESTITSPCTEDGQIKSRDCQIGADKKVNSIQLARQDEAIPSRQAKKAMDSSSDKCARATTNDEADEKHHHIDTAQNDNDEPSLLSNSMEVSLEDSMIAEKDPRRRRVEETSRCIRPDAERGLEREGECLNSPAGKSCNDDSLIDSLIDVDSIFTMPVPANENNSNKDDAVAVYNDDNEEEGAEYDDQGFSISTGNVTTDLFPVESNIDIPTDYEEEEESQEQELRDQPLLSSPALSMFSSSGILKSPSTTTSRSITPFHDVENYRPQQPYHHQQEENRNDLASSSSFRRISSIDVNHLDEFVNSCILVDEKHLVPKKKRSVTSTVTSLHNHDIRCDDHASAESEMKRISTPFFVKEDDDDDDAKEEKYVMRQAIESKTSERKKKRKFFGKSFFRRLVGKGPKFVSLGGFGSSRHRVVVKTISGSDMC